VADLSGFDRFPGLMLLVAVVGAIWIFWLWR
jgi:hypothetical protein